MSRSPVAASAAPGGVWAPHRRALTVGLVSSVTLVAFEALAVATVMPVVGRDLGDIRLYGWVFSAFLLSSLIGIVAAGTFADRMPLRWPMLTGLLLFGAGLVVGGTALDMPVLVAGRAVQGLGAGVVPAVAYVAIARGYPPSCRARMFAVLSTAWLVPGLVGPSIAALIAAVLSWRWVFLLLLPLVVGAALLTPAAVGRLAPPETDGAPEEPRVPRLPVLGLVAGAGVALAALDSGQVVAAAVVVAGAALLLASLRALTPAGTLRVRPGLPSVVGVRGLLTFCFYCGDAYVPFALTSVRHAPTYLAGITLTAATITWTAGSWIQTRAIGRVGPRRLIRGGQALVGLGLVLMLVTLLPELPAAFGIVAWSVAGIGMGLAYSPLSVTALDQAEAGGEGRATSSLQLTDVLGQALGTGTAGALVAIGARGPGDRSGVALAFALGVLLAAVGWSAGVRLPRRLRAGVT